MAAVLAALLAAQKAQPANADIARVVSAFNAWTSEGTLSGTVAKGEELGDALASLFGEVTEVINKAPISETLKADAMEEVAEVVRPTPTPYPYGPPPVADSEIEENWMDRAWAAAENPPPDPKQGFIYTHVDRTATNSVGKKVPVISMWRFVERGNDGIVLSSLADSNQTRVVTRKELDDEYKYLYEDKDRLLVAGRKTRRARGKKRRTVKRRAKSLRRRRQ